MVSGDGGAEGDPAHLASLVKRRGGGGPGSRTSVFKVK